ncbi:MAG: TIGR04283 family arsenosugar biosynthesis glycosyltransferase [Desulfobacteraceae bacterium]|nr:TIGR04283 family arsenosugar biosynthesis glycosyltransferase [Desulfobacteraceae bacterium]
MSQTTPTNMDLPPAVSVIVPVLHETGIIEQACAHLVTACSGCNAEIIIVDGDRRGSTINRVNSERIRTLSAPRGRAAQMNAGANAARGRVLLFVHADTRLPEGAVRDVLEICRRPAIAGGAFLLGIASEKGFFRMAEAWTNLRCRLTRIPYGDQAVFMKNRIFRELGGYSDIPLMEDIDLMQRLKQNGLKIALIRKPVVTSARRWEKEGRLFGMIRNNLLSCLYYAGVKPALLEKFYKTQSGSS